ncbi:MAG: hypothetical protein ACR2MS_09515 [Weeksellaceae bacterium]
MMQEPEANKKPLSLVERMKFKAKNSPKYGGEYIEEKANMSATDCPNCGAGRAKLDGVKNCAYCGYEFLENHQTKGIHLNREKGRGEL